MAQRDALTIVIDIWLDIWCVWCSGVLLIWCNSDPLVRVLQFITQLWIEQLKIPQQYTVIQSYNKSYSVFWFSTLV